MHTYCVLVQYDLFNILTLQCSYAIAEQLDAGKFYNMVRPFLNGWHEEGIIYEGINNNQPIKVSPSLLWYIAEGLYR